MRIVDCGMRIEQQKKAIRIWLGVLLVFCFPCACPVWGAGADATTLSGIEGFRVEVGALSRAALALGIDESRLQIFTREHLRRTNISVGDFPAILTISLRTVEHPTAVLESSPK